MKKSQLIIVSAILLFTVSCEKDYTELIDPAADNFQVTGVSPSAPVVYNALDSLILARINFRTSSVVSGVSCDIFDPDNNKINSTLIELADNGRPEFGDDVANDNRYSNKFPMSSLDPVGTYSIRYYANSNSGSVQLIAQTSFAYDNGQDNFAPAIANLIMPDNVAAGQTITFSVDAEDENGLNDIASVFYEAYNPNGEKVVNSQGFSEFPMFDNGNTSQNGDVTAGDGTYTVRLTFPVSVQQGVWRFEFQALDRGGLYSNKITHNILVE